MAYLVLPLSSTAVYGWQPWAIWSKGWNFSMERPIAPPCRRVRIGLRESCGTTARASSSDGVGAAKTPEEATARADKTEVKCILVSGRDKRIELIKRRSTSTDDKIVLMSSSECCVGLKEEVDDVFYTQSSCTFSNCPPANCEST